MIISGAFFGALSGVLFILILAGNKYMLKSKYKKTEHTPVIPRLVVEDTEMLVRKSDYIYSNYMCTSDIHLHYLL